jgi:hypothetical protein
MNELKWTNGESCIRSKRITNDEKSKQYLVENQESNIFNKRDIANNKINERILISQIGQNPFLSRNNYLEDLDIQENFLKPKNSNFQKD